MPQFQIKDLFWTMTLLGVAMACACWAFLFARTEAAPVAVFAASAAVAATGGGIGALFQQKVLGAIAALGLLYHSPLMALIQFLTRAPTE